MDQSFKGKVCVVTGGANGIGRCVVQSFLDHGASVAFIDLDEGAGCKLAEQYNQALFIAGDCASEAVLRDFAGKVIRRYGQVDYLINNACFSNQGILSGCSYEEFNQVLRVGVTAPYYLCLLFLNAFAPGACVVNISSTRALMSQADTESYSAAKGGIGALTHALAISLSGRVRVNAVSPGWIDTRDYRSDAQSFSELTAADKNQHPAGRVGSPADISNIVMFLCSGGAEFITGENIVVDGGTTRQMIYHNEGGWKYSLENPSDNSKNAF